MEHPQTYLIHRQDLLDPKVISIQIPGLGALQGFEFPNGVRQFFGIPFGKISKHFTRASLVTSWENDAHDGTKLGPMSLQPAPWSLVAEHESTPVKPYSYLNTPDENDGNNSLVINITVPPNQKGPLPVMVWIHGGAFMYGYSCLPTYDGFRFVSESIRKGKPVVFASINYRLGILGFLASRDIARDLKADGLQGNGNFGLTDQCVGLQWVHQYIQHFGGDEDDVTIFGESAGGMSVCSHIFAKHRPPFNRAICQSGTTAGFRIFNEEEHEELYHRVLKYFDIPINAQDALARLQAIPGRKIAMASWDIFGVVEAFPSVCDDDYFFDVKPGPLSIEPPPHWLKGFMVGNVKDEGMIFRDEIKSENLESLKTAFQRYFSSEETEWILKLYGIDPNGTTSDFPKAVEAMFADSSFLVPDLGRAHQITQTQCPVPCYFYHFDQPNKVEGMYYNEAHHAYDIQYIMLTAYEQFSDEERRLADMMHEAWIDFAYGKEPWEDYRKASRWQNWGPNGRAALVTEAQDEPIRFTSRLQTWLDHPDLFEKFVHAVEDVTTRRYLIKNPKSKGWAKEAFGQIYPELFTF